MKRINLFFSMPRPVILFCTILVTMHASPALSTPPTKNEFCNSFVGEKSNRAYLFDATGTKLLHHFDIGHLDAAKNKLDSDYIMSSQEFRLVLFPKRLEFDSYDTQSIGLQKKKIQARCTLTSEYILNFGVVARNFKPGKLETEVNIKIFDPKLRFPEYTKVKLAYQNIITGELLIPRVDIDESATLQNSLNSLFNTGERSAKISLKNTGNRPIRFHIWESGDDTQDGEIALKENTCGNIQLEPNALCGLTIVKFSAKPLSKTFYSWGSTGTTGEFEINVNLSIKKYENGDTNIEVRNR